MKITIEVDCTPEEARRTMGLPDVAAFQQAYLDRLAEAGDGAFRPELIDAMMRGWAPMGEAGLTLWRSLAEVAARPVEAGR